MERSGDAAGAGRRTGQEQLPEGSGAQPEGSGAEAITPRGSEPARPPARAVGPEERAAVGETGGGEQPGPDRETGTPPETPPGRAPAPRTPLPAALLVWLRGREDLYGRGVAHMVLTVDPAGCPHPAVVDVLLATPDGGLRFGLGGASRGLANVRRTGRATLVLADAGHLWVVKGSAAALRGSLPRGYVAVELSPEDVREDRDPRAEVGTGLTFTPVTAEGAREAAAVAAGLAAAAAP